MLAWPGWRERAFAVQQTQSQWVTLSLNDERQSTAFAPWVVPEVVVAVVVTIRE